MERKRNSPIRRDALEESRHIPLPDYAMFSRICNDVGADLGLPGKEVMRIYKAFITQSLDMLFPEGNPRDIPNEQLLAPRRILHIPRIASLEVTETSLWHWHKVQEAIKNANKN